ncbi:hypothetical protein [Desulforhopalus singaporensis]|uniref:Uncharacterized protein n=1 Tax=Desulforhopalus singaporensis TaxID=91360 RepID=A0A1H0UC16_9BACT|nr:hypothetical protein [Desulforhopalus singaporensis]SDP63386.1 hypothetical protein SAMN05660330_03471 [Desulforhopalus singaporensis]
MLAEKWNTLIVVAFAIAALINALLASCFSFYYRKIPSGRLSHGQLRIKQGNATFEHRTNVFATALVLSLFNFRIYLGAALIWLVLNFLLLR